MDEAAEVGPPHTVSQLEDPVVWIYPSYLHTCRKVNNTRFIRWYSEMLGLGKSNN